MSTTTPRQQAILKRIFDLFLAGLTLLLLTLPMLLVALWVRLDSPGPVLFRQERVGRHGLTFRMLKFRTMVHDAAAGPGAATLLTVDGDSRITRAGRWLRRRRIDEWPQLFNVLRGDMSLVGPRPEVPRYVAHYPAELAEVVLSVRPGITDPAALAFRDEGAVLAASTDPEHTYLHDLLPRKLQMQAEHIRRGGLGPDLLVLWRTAGVLMERRR